MRYWPPLHPFWSYLAASGHTSGVAAINLGRRTMLQAASASCESMQIGIKRIHRQTGTTIVFVTHDREEALALSDRICLMNGGQIEQLGTPEDIYERPATVFATKFIGIINLMHGRVEQGKLARSDGLLPLPTGLDAQDGDRGALVIRPEKMAILSPGEGLVSGELSVSQ